jgi:hypothetical protein
VRDAGRGDVERRAAERLREIGWQKGELLARKRGAAIYDIHGLGPASVLGGSREPAGRSNQFFPKFNLTCGEP